MTFYEFLVKNADPIKAEKSKVSQYAIELSGVINRFIPKFPKANRDRKTIENAFKNAMGENYDLYMFETVWQAYEWDKLFDD